MTRGDSGAQPTPWSRLRRRPDALGVGGLSLLVVSLFLTWSHAPAPPIASISGALAVNLPAGGVIPVSGFHTAVHWPLAAGIVAFGLGLVWADARGSSVAATIQGVAAAACAIVALTRFAPLPGPLCALVASILLAAAACSRWRIDTAE